jgi:hypothetical protein
MKHLTGVTSRTASRVVQQPFCALPKPASRICRARSLLPFPSL